MQKTERRRAEGKWINSRLTVFTDLYRKVRHNATKVVHVSKLLFFTSRITPTFPKEFRKLLKYILIDVH